MRRGFARIGLAVLLYCFPKLPLICGMRLEFEGVLRSPSSHEIMAHGMTQDAFEGLPFTFGQRHVILADESGGTG